MRTSIHSGSRPSQGPSRLRRSKPASRKDRRHEIKRRRHAVAPQLGAYSRLPNVVWPLLTMTAQPDVVGPIVTTDSRGQRVTRASNASIRSDSPPADAAFLLGSSYAFGVGASSDAGTLAAALSRRTGTPYVNLAVRRATSTQEVLAVLPFAERATTFVVCSGVNNLARSADSALDPLLGPTFADPYLSSLSARSLRQVSAQVKNPLRTVGTRAIAAELARRARSGFSGRPRGASSEPHKEKPGPKVQLEAAARLHLRDLRALRRLVPRHAMVAFALQPFTPRVRKDWTAEEIELFELLDEVQGKAWRRLRETLDSGWDQYAAALEHGCAELEVPFVDLSKAEYEGWCFVDRVHATDRGNEAAAALLAATLGISAPTDIAQAPAHAFADEPRRNPLEETVNGDAEDDAEEEDANVYPLW
jgi:hypothetical protein